MERRAAVVTGSGAVPAKAEAFRSLRFRRTDLVMVEIGISVEPPRFSKNVRGGWGRFARQDTDKNGQLLVGYLRPRALRTVRSLTLRPVFCLKFRATSSGIMSAGKPLGYFLATNDATAFRNFPFAPRARFG
jgi:hypothetical protein